MRQFLPEIQHHNAIHQSHHKIHIVLHEQHGHALGFETTNEFGELLFFSKAQARCRLIQQQ